MSTHETTRRIAELATDVVTGAVEYVPYADGPARFFKEQAHDVLQVCVLVVATVAKCKV